jgi:hypothetical protein
MKVANEVRLLLACARLRLEEGDRRELGESLREPLEWERVAWLAEWHGLRPLLARHLLQPGASELVPRAALVDLMAQAEAVARDNRAMRAELERLLGLLAREGIRALPYKGPTLALRAYCDLALREFGDLDLLVPREHVRRARDLLCAAGYQREYELAPAIEDAFLEASHQYHLVVRSRERGHLVELHWRSDIRFAVERLGDESWWSTTQEVDGIPTLADEDLVLLLCIHGAKHGWASLGWLVDVAELLRRGCMADWNRLLERAERMGCRRRVGLAMHLAAELLGAPLPEALRALASEEAVTRAAAALVRPMLAPTPRKPTSWELLRVTRSLREPSLDTIRELCQAVFLPSLVEWTRWPLPKPLFFAYPLLRVGRLGWKYLRRGLESAFSRRRLHT